MSRSLLRPVWQQRRTQSILTSYIQSLLHKECRAQCSTHDKQSKLITEKTTQTSIHPPFWINSWNGAGTLLETTLPRWRQRFQKVPFSLSTPKHLADVLKLLFTLRRVFKRFHFRWPKTPCNCGRKAKREKKESRFQIIRNSVEGVLIFISHSAFLPTIVPKKGKISPFFY